MKWGEAMTKRFEWIDAWRGILIILIVAGHVGLRYITPLAYIFHVAAFFFISGYLTEFLKYEFEEFIGNKFKRLIIPFISSNLLFYFIVYVVQAMGKGGVFYNNLISSTDWLRLFAFDITTDLGGATWFLLTLFFTFVLAFTVFKITGNADRNKKIPYAYFTVMTLIFLTFYALLSKGIYYPLNLELAFGAVFYFSLGQLVSLNRKKIEKALIDTNNFFLLLFISVATLFAFYVFKMQVDWPARLFRNPFMDVLGAMAGIVFTGGLAIILEKYKKIFSILSGFGKRSLTVLIFHFFYFRLCFLGLFLVGQAESAQLKSLVPLSSLGQAKSFTVFVITLILSYFTYPLLEKYEITKKLLLGEFETAKKPRSGQARFRDPELVEA